MNTHPIGAVSISNGVKRWRGSETKAGVVAQFAIAAGLDPAPTEESEIARMKVVHG
jgi:hypothetical protein